MGATGIQLIIIIIIIIFYLDLGIGDALGKNNNINNRISIAP